MKQLTVNQIMLLLDIHRGSNTQFVIGTCEADFKLLKQQKLIGEGDFKSFTENGMPGVTAKGDTVVRQIKRSYIY